MTDIIYFAGFRGYIQFCNAMIERGADGWSYCARLDWRRPIRVNGQDVFGDLMCEQNDIEFNLLWPDVELWFAHALAKESK